MNKRKKSTRKVIDDSKTAAREWVCKVKEAPDRIKQLVSLLNLLSHLADPGREYGARSIRQIVHEIQISSPGIAPRDISLRLAIEFKTEIERLPEPVRSYIAGEHEPLIDSSGHANRDAMIRLNRLLAAAATWGFFAQINRDHLERIYNTSTLNALDRGRVDERRRPSEARRGRPLVGDTIMNKLIDGWKEQPLPSEVVHILFSPGPGASFESVEFISLYWEADYRKGVVVTVNHPRLSEFDSIDCLRLRVCPVCDLYYWAARSNQAACRLRPCGQTLRARRRAIIAAELKRRDNERKRG